MAAQEGHEHCHGQPLTAGAEARRRQDLVVEDKVIVEPKSVEAVVPVHKKQVLTHLRLVRLKLGLLINFSEELIKDGISRIVNGL